jgi:hypothetical protein
MNIVERFIVAAAKDLKDRCSDDRDWLALPMKIRLAIRHVTTAGVRFEHPIPDLAQLINALKKK